jgi:hypothetical protein
MSSVNAKEGLKLSTIVIKNLARINLQSSIAEIALMLT